MDARISFVVVPAAVVCATLFTFPSTVLAYTNWPSSSGTAGNDLIVVGMARLVSGGPIVAAACRQQGASGAVVALGDANGLTGDWQIFGGDGNDVIRMITYAGENPSSGFCSRTSSGGNIHSDWSPMDYQSSSGTYYYVSFFGGDDDDDLIAYLSVHRGNMDGGADEDFIISYGGGNGFFLIGGSQDDEIHSGYGGSGSEVIWGGSGNDCLSDSSVVAPAYSSFACQNGTDQWNLYGTDNENPNDDNCEGAENEMCVP